MAAFLAGLARAFGDAGAGVAAGQTQGAVLGPEIQAQQLSNQYQQLQIRDYIQQMQQRQRAQEALADPEFRKRYGLPDLAQFMDPSTVAGDAYKTAMLGMHLDALAKQYPNDPKIQQAAAMLKAGVPDAIINKMLNDTPKYENKFNEFLASRNITPQQFADPNLPSAEKQALWQDYQKSIQQEKAQDKPPRMVVTNEGLNRYIEGINPDGTIRFKTPAGRAAIPAKMQETIFHVRTAIDLLPKMEASAKALDSVDMHHFMSDWAAYHAPNWLKATAGYYHRYRPRNIQFFENSGMVTSEMSSAYGGGAMRSAKLFNTLRLHIPDPSDNPQLALEKVHDIQNGIIGSEKKEIDEMYQNPVDLSKVPSEVTPLSADDEGALGAAGLGK